MRKLETRFQWLLLLSLGAAATAAAQGCGDSGDSAATTAATSTASSTVGTGGEPASSSSTTATSTTSTMSTGGAGGTGTGGVATGGTGGVGGTMTTSTGGTGTGGTGGSTNACTTTAKTPTRGSAIALNSTDDRLIAVNRDVGTVTVMSVDYNNGGQPTMTSVAELNVCANGTDCEPWQVVIDGCDTTAYVITRKEQRVVRIDNLAGTPTVGAASNTGSEPTGLAITPNNTNLYVANWVDGTLGIFDPTNLASLGSVDLNATIAGTGALGTVTARPALAHPRALAITNNGDGSDADESIIVTEWYALRTGPESIATADTNWKGIVYKVDVATGTPTTIDLPPVVDSGFKDHKNAVTGCFPNQVGSVTIDGNFAWVTSTCASPKGPLGVFTKGACTTNAQCAGINVASVCSAGACTLACTVDSDCGFGSPAGTCTLPAGTCGPDPQDAKSTTHPAVSIVDLTANTATTENLDNRFFNTNQSSRMPLLPTDIGFVNNFAYVTGEGADGVFRLTTSNGTITSVGSANNNFIDLRKDANDTLIRLPIGIATGHTQAFGFVDDDGSRDVTALAFSAQAIAGNPAQNDFRITQSSALPTAGTPDDKALRGKRFFNPGLGRWSLAKAAWGSCGACHIDGLSDNVTWYFNRGPRQTVSLEGTFASGDPTDQRILNWTAIFDEVADFELNTRGVSGGLGAIVDANAKRINIAAESPPQQGLMGSTQDVADPMGSGAHPHSVIADWGDITAYVQRIRSPRKPTTLVAADVAAGKTLFSSVAQGNCVACHSGAKWTISRRFYQPGDGTNPADGILTAPSLEGRDWSVQAKAASFPAALFPVVDTANAKERSGVFPGNEQIQCILRPVGTIAKDPNNVNGALGVSDPAVNVLELRQDMVTVGEGINDKGRGFNPPSLLGMSVGGPYFHAGNARTLEEVFADPLFAGHHRSAVAQVFTPTPAQVKQLVAYLLSIDEAELPFAIPALSNTGGDFCQ